jgi:DNA topoisomerase I
MAEKTLVIVESPAKAKTINKYLGRNYIVEASVGHIKDLITFRLGVDIENDFQPEYKTIRGKGDIIKNIKKLSKTSKQVLIATDPDREGEAIAYHLANIARMTNDNVQRVLFNEITKAGVKKGIAEQREINEDLFMSQQARRVMDRIIGYKVSPLLSQAMIAKTSKALSAGRVQSVALNLICERETEIKKFVPIDYWSIYGDFKVDNSPFTAKLVQYDGKKLTNPSGSAKGMTEEESKKIDEKISSINFIRTEDQAQDLLERIKKEDYTISAVTKKKVTRKPGAPFTTSSLQQEASRRLGYSNKKTMMLAQRLYEGVTIGKEGQIGLITYMRTDSVRISDDAIVAARELIAGRYGKEYVPEKSPEYFSKSKNVQDAHEAIRPTSMVYHPNDVREYLEKDQAAMYDLIFSRFIASQMNPAAYDQTSVDIDSENFKFKVTGSILKFKGFLAVYDDIKDDKRKGKDEVTLLPEGIAKGKDLDLDKVDSQKSSTKAPPRYNSASLVKEMDELGIGRPSTYAAIISTLLDREYVEMEKKAFFPTELGTDVDEILLKNFSDIINVGFTADMELSLDKVAEGELKYAEMLGNFYGPFEKTLKHAEEHGDFPVIKCEKCDDGVMVIKVSRRGRFLGCSNYPDCKGTKPLPADEKKRNEPPKIVEGINCDLCSKEMVLRESRFGRFYGCIDYPKCKGTKPISTGVKCPKCEQGEVVEKFSPKSKKKFWGCSRYPDCDHITNHEPIKRICGDCANEIQEIRYKKADEGWQKYIYCPGCKNKVDVAE